MFCAQNCLFITCVGFEVAIAECNLPPPLLAEWPGSFTCCCGNTGVERIRQSVSTESRPWRRTFSRHSCRDSNQRPFAHESSTLPLSYPRSLSRSLFTSMSIMIRLQTEIEAGEAKAQAGSALFHPVTEEKGERSIQFGVPRENSPQPCNWFSSGRARRTK